MTIEKSQIFWTMPWRRQKLKERKVSHETIVHGHFRAKGASFPAWRAGKYKMPGEPSDSPVRVRIAA
jgi:hypothetical protein